MRVKTNQVAINASRVSTVSSWIEKRRAGKKSADMTRREVRLKCARALGLNLAMVQDVVRSLGMVS